MATAFSVASPLRTSSHHNATAGVNGSTPVAKKGAGQDRFIPPRGGVDLDYGVSSQNISNTENEGATALAPEMGMSTPGKRQYVRCLAGELNVSCPGEEQVCLALLNLVRNLCPLIRARCTVLS